MVCLSLQYFKAFRGHLWLHELGILFLGILDRCVFKKSQGIIIKQRKEDNIKKWATKRKKGRQRENCHFL